MTDKGVDRRPFKYRQSIEHKVGKRTGYIVRKSQITKDFDGLHNVNDYFDSASEKVSLNTEELESIALSDIEIEKSREDSIDSKESMKKSKNKNKRRSMYELSSQKIDTVFDDIMNDVSSSDLMNKYPFTNNNKNNNNTTNTINTNPNSQNFLNNPKPQIKNYHHKQSHHSPYEHPHPHPHHQQSQVQYPQHQQSSRYQSSPSIISTIKKDSSNIYYELDTEEEEEDKELLEAMQNTKANVIITATTAATTTTTNAVADSRNSTGKLLKGIMSNSNSNGVGIVANQSNGNYYYGNTDSSYVTKTPTVSATISASVSENESIKKLNTYIKNTTKHFNQYYVQIQKDKELQQMRDQLKNIDIYDNDDIDDGPSEPNPTNKAKAVAVNPKTKPNMATKSDGVIGKGINSEMVSKAGIGVGTNKSGNGLRVGSVNRGNSANGMAENGVKGPNQATAMTITTMKTTNAMATATMNGVGNGVENENGKEGMMNIEKTRINRFKFKENIDMMSSSNVVNSVEISPMKSSINITNNISSMNRNDQKLIFTRPSSNSNANTSDNEENDQIVNPNKNNVFINSQHYDHDHEGHEDHEDDDNDSLVIPDSNKSKPAESLKKYCAKKGGKSVGEKPKSDLQGKGNSGNDHAAKPGNAHDLVEKKPKGSNDKAEKGNTDKVGKRTLDKAERNAEKAEKSLDKAERNAEKAERNLDKAERNAEKAERNLEKAERNVEKADKGNNSKKSNEEDERRHVKAKVKLGKNDERNKDIEMEEVEEEERQQQLRVKDIEVVKHQEKAQKKPETRGQAAKKAKKGSKNETKREKENENPKARDGFASLDEEKKTQSKDLSHVLKENMGESTEMRRNMEKEDKSNSDEFSIGLRYGGLDSGDVAGTSGVHDVMPFDDNMQIQYDDVDHNDRLRDQNVMNPGDVVKKKVGKDGVSTSVGAGKSKGKGKGNQMVGVDEQSKAKSGKGKSYKKRSKSLNEVDETPKTSTNTKRQHSSKPPQETKGPIKDGKKKKIAIKKVELNKINEVNEQQESDMEGLRDIEKNKQKQEKGISKKAVDGNKGESGSKTVRKRKRENITSRVKYLELYDEMIGRTHCHLIEKEIIKPSTTTYFGSNERYPKRNRVQTMCFWRNEKPIYMNNGNGIEVVGIQMMEEIETPVRKNNSRSFTKNKSISITARDDSEEVNPVVKKLKKTVEPRKEEKNEIQTTKKQTTKNIYDLNDKIIPSEDVQLLHKDDFDYRILSEDDDTLTVYIKLKPKQSKEPQKNVAGPMQCTVISCQDGKPEVFCGEKKYLLHMKDRFVIPRNAIYSINNKSTTKDLEINCTILK